MLRKFEFRAGPPPEPRVDPVHTDILERVRVFLAQRDVRGAVEHLNLHSSFRFTTLSRFDPPLLRGVYLYDKLHRGTVEPVTQGADDSYAFIIRNERRPFWTEDSMMDTRLLEHPARVQVRSYVGAPIKVPGAIWGVLAHFDKRPRKVPEGEGELLLQAADMIARELYSNRPAA